jgi:hypothetical protein
MNKPPTTALQRLTDQHTSIEGDSPICAATLQSPVTSQYEPEPSWLVRAGLEKLAHLLDQGLRQHLLTHARTHARRASRSIAPSTSIPGIVFPRVVQEYAAPCICSSLESVRQDLESAHKVNEALQPDDLQQGSCI